MEIKTAWRIINQSAGDDPSRYYTQNRQIAVPGDLVRGGQQFCSSVRFGLVGMHIIQRNPVDPRQPQLMPQWIWATFEHMDNAPMAQSPCNVSKAVMRPRIGSTNRVVDRPRLRPRCATPTTNKIRRCRNQHRDPRLMGSGLQVPLEFKAPYAQGNTTAATQCRKQRGAFQSTRPLLSSIRSGKRFSCGQDTVPVLHVGRHAMGWQRRTPRGHSFAVERGAGDAFKHDAGNLYTELHTGHSQPRRTWLVYWLPQLRQTVGRHQSRRRTLASCRLWSIPQPRAAKSRRRNS